MFRFAKVAVPLAVLATGASSQDRPLYKDPKQPVDRRVADLLGRMTREEKIAQVGNDAPAIPRLGVPAYEWWNEALHGVARAGAATVFPQALSLIHI